MSDALAPPVADAGLHRPRASLGPGARLVMSVLLPAALVGGVAWGAVEIRSGAGDTASGTPAGSPSSELSQRRAVQLAVSSFAANLTTYSVDDVGGYKARLSPLMTAGFAKSFGLAVDGIIAEVKATKMRSQGQVVETAVSAVDSDSATALVVADVQVQSSLGDRVRHFRWQVTLLRQGGSWLVDGFEPIA